MVSSWYTKGTPTMPIMVTFRFRDPALTDDVLRATADLRGNMETHIYEEHAVPDADLHPKSEETRAGIGDPDFGDNPEYFDLLLDVVRPRPATAPGAGWLLGLHAPAGASW